ncbi:hypothetical protein HDE_10890 [Halotydeus destructor]|nr:hypothetical protein HDE_10890 [Halotydeus destructor]
MVSRGSRVQFRAYPIDHHVWIGIGTSGQHITEADLERTLSEFGPIVGVSLKELRSGDNYAFASFFKAADARKALAEKVWCKGVLLRILKKVEPKKRNRHDANADDEQSEYNGDYDRRNDFK